MPIVQYRYRYTAPILLLSFGYDNQTTHRCTIVRTQFVYRSDYYTPLHNRCIIRLYDRM